jgi:hypothetical protein
MDSEGRIVSPKGDRYILGTCQSEAARPFREARTRPCCSCPCQQNYINPLVEELTRRGLLSVLCHGRLALRCKHQSGATELEWARDADAQEEAEFVSLSRLATAPAVAPLGSDASAREIEALFL